LGSIPPRLNWDETAIGWNSFSIWETRLDEYGTRLPLSFRSFGDYKAPFLIYATAPFVGLLGLEEWVVRLPVALAGLASIFIFYFLALEISRLLKLDKTSSKLFTLVSSISFALSPWHIFFSRAAYEVNIALFLLSFKKPYLYLFLGLAFLCSLYAYHSPKLFLPPFLLGLLILFRKKILLKTKTNLLFLIIALLLLIPASIPLIRENIKGEGLTRISTSIFYKQSGEKEKFNLKIVGKFVNNYVSHFSPNFYLSGNSNNFRVGLKNYGLMPLVQYLLFFIGIYFLFKIKKNKGVRLLAIWLLLGFLPAAIGREVPHSLRSLLALPAIILISGFGLVKIYNLQKAQKQKFLYIVATLFLLSLIRFGSDYFYKFPVYSGADWQYGYKQAAQTMQKYEDEVEKIVVTGHYGQSYVFTYFFQKRQPMQVLWGAMSKYIFKDGISWDGDQFLSKHLLVGTPEEIPDGFPKERGEIVEEIKYPNGEVVFRIVKLN
jgi:4-amino-4-deoxy-L-arabinose transferase-like glycosyltransferase